jgi:hypothetical protein
LPIRATRWEDKPSVTRRAGPTYVEFAGMGVTAGACVAVGVGGGYWIGTASGAGPAVTFAGLGVGVLAAVAATYFKIKRYL